MDDDGCGEFSRSRDSVFADDSVFGLNGYCMTWLVFLYKEQKKTCLATVEKQWESMVDAEQMMPNEAERREEAVAKSDICHALLLLLLLLLLFGVKPDFFFNVIKVLCVIVLCYFFLRILFVFSFILYIQFIHLKD